MLTAAKRKKVRAITRSAWIRSNGDKDKAIELVKEEARYEFGLITYVIVIYYVVSLALRIISFWIDNRVSVPPEEPMEGEPQC